MNGIRLSFNKYVQLFKKCHEPQFKNQFENVEPDYVLNFQMALGKIMLFSILRIIWKISV